MTIIRGLAKNLQKSRRYLFTSAVTRGGKTEDHFFIIKSKQMKQIKKFMLLASMILAISFAFAFRPAEQVKKADTFYYVYSGESNDLEDLKAPGNWGSPLTEDPDGCNGGTVLPCVVSSPFSDKDDFIEDIETNEGITGTIEHYRHL